ncbi:glycosyltransferase family 4 protein [Halovivax limisalsi]|uniref:glycosyltransferase family 4 protein n=1 Tax=Halovivax limisalsi TaxID=1453760 RepID=UPI001FFC75EE|nr:glycosyltransferase family 4 protein [Halovivax limisalsi]
MRVLQLTTNADATYVTNQIEALASLGVESDVLEVPRSGSDGRSAADYVRFCPTVRARDFSAYDLVHANFGLTIPAALSQRRVPVVTSLVGTDLMGRYGPLTKGFVRFCDDVIVVNPSMADRLSRDVHVIPHGIDLEQFRPIETDHARAVVDWPSEGYHVLFPYHPSRSVKNYPLAERVVATTDDRVAGDVELHTISGVDYDLIPYYMNAADALVLTSHREGSPSTVKEALACNTPVVATPVGDVPERLAGVEPGGVADSVDALAATLRETLAATEPPNGRDAVRSLGLERMGERILSVYRRVVE